MSAATTQDQAPPLPHRLRAHVQQMAAHHREREGGKLLIEALEEIERLTKRFTRLDLPRYSGAPMLDSVISTPNPEFRAWAESLPATYWVRYDLSAARIGWEAAIQTSPSPGTTE